MKNYNLSKTDIKIIKDQALVLWKNRIISGDNFVTECYIDAFLSFLISKNLTIVNGKLYVQQKCD